MSQGKKNRESGIILITVLWILVILTMLAVGLARQTSVELALIKHAVGEVRAKYIAWAGLTFAIDQIRQDKEDETTSRFDTLNQCGIRLPDGKMPESVLKNIPVAGGYFDISYTERASPKDKMKTYYGLQDEERRINLNGINQQNYKILSYLISLLGYDDTVAQTIAYSVADWQDTDDEVAGAGLGAEDSFYMSLSKPYHCKNQSFSSVEELLFVRGVQQEIFDKVKDYLTVYPQGGVLLVNFDTAPEIVLQAVARSLTGALTNTDLVDADNLVKRIIDYRRGNDGEDMTADDKALGVNIGDLGGNQSLSATISGMRAMTSNHFRVHVKAVDEASPTTVHLEAVVSRMDGSILSWHRE